jgi:UTP-glucose-1-phosphate uridylyltransferase
VGKVTTATVPRLVSGVTYFFAITSCGKNGLESSFSNEISYERRLPAVPEKAKLDKVQIGSTHAVVGIDVTGTGQPVLTVQGLIGKTYYILAAQTATDWAVIGTVKLDTNGSAEFIDTNAASFQQRFYRAQQKP